MPTYLFACHDCGPFEAWRAAADAGSAPACPACGRPARRRYTAPAVFRTPAPLRAARSREERSAHEPEVVGAPAGRPLRHGHHERGR